MQWVVANEETHLFKVLTVSYSESVDTDGPTPLSSKLKEQSGKGSEDNVGDCSALNENSLYRLPSLNL